MSPFLDGSVPSQIATLAAGYLALRVGLGGAALLLARRAAFGRDHRVYAEPEPEGQIADELRHTVAITLFDAVFLTAVIRSGAVHLTPGAAWAVAPAAAATLLANELSFYGFHRLLHRPQWYGVHAQHHKARVSDPFTAFSFSLAEHALILPPAALFLAALSWVAPVSLATMAAVAITSEVLACYGHMNVEVWGPGFPSSWLGSWLMTPTFHGMHHARLRGNYGLFTRIPDRLFGTECPDYAALHDRVAAGSPLPSRRTRGDARASGAVA